MESPSRLLYKTSIWIIIVYEELQFGSTDHPSMVREVSTTQLIINFLLIRNSENNNMSFLQVCSTSNPQFQIWLLKKQTYALSGLANEVVLYGDTITKSQLWLLFHYKKPCDPWRYSHDVFKFRHRSHCIHDELSDFVIDAQCWIWSPISSPNTMTLCQFCHRFRHRSRCIHNNIQNSS
jgi:hypothetical protein